MIALKEINAIDESSSISNQGISFAKEQYKDADLVLSFCLQDGYISSSNNCYWLTSKGFEKADELKRNLEKNEKK